MKVKIKDLKVTGEDEWMLDWIEKSEGLVSKSPHYLYLKGNPVPIVEWMINRNLPMEYLTGPLIEVLVSLIKDGQKEPIKIYKDKRICTGHKRASCLLYLGKDTIEAEIVSDDYKL